MDSLLPGFSLLVSDDRIAGDWQRFILVIDSDCSFGSEWTFSTCETCRQLW